MTIPIKARERTAIIQSLRAGVVPRIGLHHIQVGRRDEIQAMLKDLENIEQDSSAVRFVVGPFGSGKTFFLNLIRTLAQQKNLLVAQADITTERRLQATGGQARALYAELMNNLSSRSKPEGNALSSVVERWVADIDHKVRSQNGDDDDVHRAIQQALLPLQELVSGYDFARVLGKYYEGFRNNEPQLQLAALRWLRAEYPTKTEARQDLGVRSIIDDANFYDYLKLMSAFVRQAGYNGLLINLDEMGVLTHRLTNSQARATNFEAILRIVNDCLQGTTSGIGFIFSGTTEFLEDRRRGLFSYGALATRLADSHFVTGDTKDFASPVIRMQNLSPEDLFVLLHNIRHVFASGEQDAYLIDDEGIAAFMTYCARHLGAEYFRTPRDSVRQFVALLSMLEQDPTKTLNELLAITPPANPPNQSSNPTPAKPAIPQAAAFADQDAFDDPDDDFTDFKL